jgi:hypothetical protein
MNDHDKADIKSKLRMMMGVHGIANVMECMVEIAEEFGEGALPSGRYAEPDPWWLEASAHLSSAHDEIWRISRHD